MKLRRDQHQLIQDWIHGSITPEDFQTLQQLLLRDPHARRLLRHEVNLDMVLRDLASMDDCLNSWLPDRQPLPSSSADATKGKILPFRQPWLAWAAAAIILLATGGYWIISTNSLQQNFARNEATTQGAAILTRTANAVWVEDHPSPRAGDTLPAGTIKLVSGFAQIEFYSGATVLMSGPAELEINSSWLATCRSGKVRARVPPPAQGFIINTPQMEIEDLGTEFGVEVDPLAHSTEVHVFEGEVNARPRNASVQLVHLKEGEGLRRCSAGLTPIKEVRPDDFVCLARMDALSKSCAESRYSQWKEWKKQFCSDKRILAFYPFQRSCNWERAADNDANTNNTTGKVCSGGTGGIVGARWTQGRWPGKDALEFKRPGDRVRIRLEGEYEGLTFACWLRVDGLDRKYNALLLTDGFEQGEPHWQILEDGRVMFTIAPPNPSALTGEIWEANSYYTPVIFTHSNLGRWHHLAVTYDALSGETVHYFDGRQISRAVPKKHPSGCTVAFGSCEIGNWGLPAVGHKHPIRNFNGCIDEFVIYKTPLPEKELRGLYLAGRQD